MSRDVVSLAYVNAYTNFDGPYEHDFAGTGTELWALSDGGLLIRNPKHRLWSDYNVSDAT